MLQPSFRGRLRLFFAVIVIVPMLAVALVLFRLVDAADAGKVDARLAEARQGAQGLYNEARSSARRSASAASQDRDLSTALRDRRSEAIQRQLDQLATDIGATRIQLDASGIGRFQTGEANAIAPGTVNLQSSDGTTVGPLTVSQMGAGAFASQLSRVLGVEAVVKEGGEVIAASLPAAGETELPDGGRTQVSGDDYRVATLGVPAFDGGQTTVKILIPDPSGSVWRLSTLVVVGVVIAFLLLAIVFATLVSRTLQAEIDRLLQAARRLGRGDFSIAVPAEGSDEFAQLGAEFNAMASRLKTQMGDLEHSRTRLQTAIRRSGEAVSQGLNLKAQLEIIIEAAVDGVGAAGGRATIREEPGDPLEEVASVGRAHEFRRALQAAEAAVADAHEVTEITVANVSAIAAPLGAHDGTQRIVGTVSIARPGAPFTEDDKDLFAFLTRSAAVASENNDLHETVRRQAMTDELTGLFNHRRFQEVMTTEVERARRYDQDMGLIMLDIDNFKRVNDTYGHLQGDVVLREVAKVLRDAAREVDEPARYGGEEMAVALPQTDLEGAYRFAERVRRRIESLDLDMLDGAGKLKVTASFGAASLVTSAGTDKDALVAAADAALYRAKRSGKNRTVKAG